MRKKNKVRRARSEHNVKQTHIVHFPSVPSSTPILADGQREIPAVNSATGTYTKSETLRRGSRKPFSRTREPSPKP